jgi:fructose-1,6-bisphosphatase/inositol monophosphatase family enzyme
MMGALTISLLSSLALFLGLSAWARRRIQHAPAGAAAWLMVLVGSLSVLWLTLDRHWSYAASALLIGLLGYCFGHFTAPRVKSVVE